MTKLKQRRWARQLFAPAAPLLRHAGHLLLWYARRLDPAQPQRILAWRAIAPNDHLRYEYPLHQDAVVIDAGGYLGDFATEINARYNAHVFVYEPIPDFCQKIDQRLGENSKVQTICAGLGATAQQVTMSLDEESTSAHLGQGDLDVQVLAFDQEMKRLGIKHIDLMKINIEGGEYDLIDHLFATGWIDRITDLQIQFHDFVPEAQARRDAIRQRLSRTHQSTYCVDFVWENWHRTATQQTALAA